MTSLKDLVTRFTGGSKRRKKSPTTKILRRSTSTKRRPTSTAGRRTTAAVRGVARRGQAPARATTRRVPSLRRAP